VREEIEVAHRGGGTVVVVDTREVVLVESAVAMSRR